MNYSLGESLLQIDKVGYSVGGFPILTGVNAEVRKITADVCHGQVVGFLGLSGSGKTSLFRVIAGLVKPTEGQVVLNHTGQPVQAGEVGVVAQNYPLFNHRTVFSNLMLAAKKKTPNEKEARERVLECLEEFQLMDRRAAYPAQLSGGQKQRAAILQQVLCPSHFLLMDEPFSGLDVKMEEKTIELIQRVASKDAFNTVIVITHDVTAACSVADHIWILGGAKEENGKRVSGSRIVREYNLIDEDLCWHPEITTQPRFAEFVREMKAYFTTL